MRKLITKILPLIYGQYFNLFSLFAPQKTAHEAFIVFCTVRKGRILLQQKDYLEQAKDKVIEAAGHQIQTYSWPGKKETVLLVHGWESNSFRWRNLIQKLKEADFNIIAFDAPSHGYSSGKLLYVPLYEEAVHDLIKIYNPKYVIGHSVGGMTLMYNEYKNPNPNIEKIVTIGSPSEFQGIMDNFQRILKFNNRFMGHMDTYVYNRFGFHIQDFSTSKFAKTNTKKGLLLHDRFDKIAPYQASVDVHQNWKNSKLLITEGLGHSMHQDEANAQIIAFLES